MLAYQTKEKQKERKKYKAECLAKFQVMNTFPFSIMHNAKIAACYESLIKI